MVVAAAAAVVVVMVVRRRLCSLLVRMAARWRPSGPTKGCAARSDTRTGSPWALNDADRPGWRPAVAIGGPDLAEAEEIIEEKHLESIEDPVTLASSSTSSGRR